MTRRPRGAEDDPTMTSLRRGIATLLRADTWPASVIARIRRIEA
jgi:hypothetical protein